jgi:hypothetical protein
MSLSPLLSCLPQQASDKTAKNSKYIDKEIANLKKDLMRSR